MFVDWRDRGTASRALHRPLALLALAALAAAVVGCGGGGASPAPSEPGGQTASPPASEAASQEPESPAPTESSGPIASLPAGGAEDLVALLPAEVQGVRFERGGYDFANLPGYVPIDLDESGLQGFLQEQGKSIRDVQVAIGFADQGSTQAAGTMVMAIQVKGVDAAALDAWAAEELASGASTQTVGGKRVYGERVPGMAAWVYVKGDTVFWVFGLDAKLVEGIVAALP